MPRRVVVRAVLTSTAVVLLVAPALVLAGAFLPNVAQISRLGALVNEGLPWIVVAVIAALVLGGIAVALGGRRFTLALLVATLAVAIGGGVVAVRYEAFANGNHATYDMGRGLGPEPADRPADASFTYPTIDPAVQLHAELWRAPAGAPNAGPNGRGGDRVRPRRRVRRRGIAPAPGAVRRVRRGRLPGAGRGVPARAAAALVRCARGRAVRARLPAVDRGDGGHRPGARRGDGRFGRRQPGAAGRVRRRHPAAPPSCPGEPIMPAGVVAIAPAADLAGIWADGTLVAAGLPFPEAYVGGSPAACRTATPWRRRSGSSGPACRRRC